MCAVCVWVKCTDVYAIENFDVIEFKIMQTKFIRLQHNSAWAVINNEQWWSKLLHKLSLSFACWTHIPFDRQTENRLFFIAHDILSFACWTRALSFSDWDFRKWSFVFAEALYVTCKLQNCTDANKGKPFPGYIDPNSLVVQDEYVFVQVSTFQVEFCHAFIQKWLN